MPTKALCARLHYKVIVRCCFLPRVSDTEMYKMHDTKIDTHCKRKVIRRHGGMYVLTARQHACASIMCEKCASQAGIIPPCAFTRRVMKKGSGVQQRAVLLQAQCTSCIVRIEANKRNKGDNTQQGFRPTRNTHCVAKATQS